MRFARAVATAAAIALAPSLGHATTYRLDAVVDGTPEPAFGAVTIDPTIVASGSLSLSRFCPQFSACQVSGPWDQVSFTLPGRLEPGLTSNGPGTDNAISLIFNAAGDVVGHSILIEPADPNPVLLNVGPTFSGVFSGVYIAIPLGDALPITLTFVQQIPEPGIGFAGLLIGTACLVGMRRRSAPTG